MKADEFDKTYSSKLGISLDEARRQRLAFIEAIKHGLLVDGKVDFFSEFSMETYRTKETTRSVATNNKLDGERKSIEVPSKIKIRTKFKKGFLDFIQFAKVKEDA